MGKEAEQVEQATEDTAIVLLLVNEYIERAREALDSVEFGVLQGSLRAAFSGLAGVVINSPLDQARKTQLATLADGIFHYRDELVTAIEVDKKTVQVAAKEFDLYERLAKIKTNFETYLASF